MKVIEWIDPYNESPSPVPVDGRRADYLMFLYSSDKPESERKRLSEEAWEAVKRELREKGYRFSGMRYLDGPKTVPVLDNDMTFDVSIRAFSRLMFEAWHPDDNDPMGYAKYLNELSDGEVEVLPN